jgi:hypothetical protein
MCFILTIGYGIINQPYLDGKSMDINVLTIQETILFVGLFLGLLISIGIALLAVTTGSKSTDPSQVILETIIVIFFQWIPTILIVGFILFCVFIISIIQGKL